MKIYENAPEPAVKINQVMLDTIHVGAKNPKSTVVIQPKPPFKLVFRVAAAAEKRTEIRIINEPIKGTSVFLVETGES